MKPSALPLIPSLTGKTISFSGVVFDAAEKLAGKLVPGDVIVTSTQKVQGDAGVQETLVVLEVKPLPTRHGGQAVCLRASSTGDGLLFHVVNGRIAQQRIAGWNGFSYKSVSSVVALFDGW